MRIIEPPLAGICQDMIDCIGNKDAEARRKKRMEEE